MTSEANGQNQTNGAKIHGSMPDAATPFQGQQPYGMPADLVVPKIMELDNIDEKLWVRRSLSKSTRKHSN
jgi:hypothetical protein